ncbi:hypothetical protein IX51_03615 [uncultured archaeon]|nr:hypothetical protein IX51_03615 [uncultured archaeon]
MIPDYEKVLSIFPTFFFIVMFLIMSALYYNRYHTEESDEKATRHFRDYIAIMNSQSVLISSINGMILIILYNQLMVGVTLLLITQALATYVFVSLYMKSHYDSLFFLIFSVLAYVFEFLYFLFAGIQTEIFGRSMGGLEVALIVFVIIIAVLSLILASLAAYVNRTSSDDGIY